MQQRITELYELFRPRNRATKIALFLMIPLTAATVAVVFHTGSRWPGGLLWALASMALGATLGFLFGIPKVLQTAAPSPAPSSAPPKDAQDGKAPATSAEPSGNESHYQVAVNTNLEQISDWLTKIIVGLGLMNISKFPGNVVAFSRYVGLSFGPDPANERFACALLTCFTLIGFAMGYLLTRLYLQNAFAEADRAATGSSEFRDELARAMRKSSNREGGLPTDSQRVAAEHLGELSITVEEKVIREQVDALAREYERTRASLRAGDERVKRLDDCVARMRPLALAARFLLKDLKESTSPGYRLFAISTLTVAPDVEHLPWIVARFDQNEERPFVVYHAAVALLAAADKLSLEEIGSSVTDAIERAKKLSADPARDRVLAQAVETLERKKPAPK